jgi:hypothetical protein
VAIVVVGGSTKDIGKTALVCAIISAFREFDWTAVKITAHDYTTESVDRIAIRSALREEMTENGGTDTSRYLAAGARRSLLVTWHGGEVPLEEMERAVGADRNVIYESNRVIDAMEPDVCIALAGGSLEAWKPSFVRLLQKADALVSCQSIEIESGMVRREIPHFRLQSPDCLTPDLVDWLRLRLTQAQPGDK